MTSHKHHRKSRHGANRKSGHSSTPGSFQQMVRAVSGWIQRILLFLLGGGLVILTVIGIILVAAPRIFELEQVQNILFVYHNLNDGKGELYLASFYPEQQEVLMNPVNNDKVDVLGGYGQYQLSALYHLLQLEHKDPNFITASYSWAMHTIVDDVIILPQAGSFASKQELVRVLRRELFANRFSWKQMKTTARLYSFTRLLPSDAYLFTAEEKSGTQGQTVASRMYKSCDVAIVNTTGQAGLAFTVGSMLEGAGANVIRITDQEGAYQLTTVDRSPNDPFCQPLATRITHIFPSETVMVDDSVRRQEQRADLVLYLGKDIGQLQ